MNLFILAFFLVNSEAITIPEPPLPTPASSVAVQLRARQTTSFGTLCGYSNGDIEIPRTAEPGYACREDTVDNLWGFCLNTIAEATNCDFVGYCIDDGTCSTGCGRSSLTQIQWYIHYLTVGQIACHLKTDFTVVQTQCLIVQQLYWFPKNKHIHISHVRHRQPPTFIWPVQQAVLCRQFRRLPDHKYQRRNIILQLLSQRPHQLLILSQLVRKLHRTMLEP